MSKFLETAEKLAYASRATPDAQRALLAEMSDEDLATSGDILLLQLVVDGVIDRDQLADILPRVDKTLPQDDASIEIRLRQLFPTDEHIKAFARHFARRHGLDSSSEEHRATEGHTEQPVSE